MRSGRLELGAVVGQRRGATVRADRGLDAAYYCNDVVRLVPLDSNRPNMREVQYVARLTRLHAYSAFAGGTVAGDAT